jgi:hypothetical protein
MSHDEYQAIEQIGIDVAQLSTLLAFVARGLDGRETDAVEACATLAETIANRVDKIPGFLDAQRSRSEGS